ncbi:MAG: hypothetical protein V1701_11575 [Planctomycetota bacterium]
MNIENMDEKNKPFLFTIGITALIFLLFSSSVYANAGTPLILAGIFHLPIGNAIIGLIEGLIIFRFFKTNKILSILAMVIANYASMFAGMFLMGILYGKTENVISIYNVTYALMALLFTFFLITLIIEWPFCFVLFIKQGKKITRSLYAVIIVNTISYILLIPFYWLFSGLSLINGTELDKTLSFVKDDKAWVYYISPNDGDIYRAKLNGTSVQKIKDAKISGKYKQLFLRPADEKPYMDLWVLDKENSLKGPEYLIISHVIDHVTVSSYQKEKDFAPWFKSVDFRPDEQRDWDVYTGFWSIEGLSAKNKKTGQHFWIALETPFIDWSMRNLTILPNDQVIFQLGDNQIIILDLNSRKLGLITKGRSPVVIMGN